MNEKQSHFVENEVSPLLASEGVMVLDDEFVRRDAHMECVCFAPALKINTNKYKKLRLFHHTRVFDQLRPCNLR